LALKTYHGSCHCGALHYTAEIDFSQGTTRCNCSYCSKVRAWFAFIPTDKLRLEGADALSEYTWTPPGRDEAFLHFRFCRHCGVRVLAEGGIGPFDHPFYALAMATLDDADPDELAASIRYVDGRHDRYNEVPADTRLL
jgi:hypothetical protein